MKLRIDEGLLKDITIFDAVALSFTPDNNFSHVIQNLRNVDCGWITERLLVDELGIKFPEGYKKSY